MTTEQLLTHAQLLARALRTEGRINDAAIVDALLNTINKQAADELLSLEEVAQQIGVTRQAVANWIKQGWMEGIQIGNHLLVPAAALRRVHELNPILAALDDDRPPASDEEIADALQVDRKDWTWIGKTE